jgi:integrating conjugative element membrane protein (TIGR03747 family)
VEAVSALLASIVVSFVLGTFIEWIGMHWWWRHEGVNHSKAMVVEDLNHLREYRRSLITEDAVAFAAGWALAATAAFEWVGVTRFIQQQVAGPAVSPADTRLQRAVKSTLRDTSKYLTAAIYVAQDTAIRLAVVMLAIPAFALACLLGMVDGLGRRDIRKWSGGRESSFVYHHAKRVLRPALTGGFTLYLTWPTAGFNPAWMILPFCGAVGCTVSLMAATFKKYL